MPKNLLRRITKKFVITVNLVLAAVFLVSLLSYYLNPVTYWYIAFLGFAFPFLLLLVVLFVVFWLVFKSKWSLLNIALLLIGWQNVHAVFGLNVMPPSYTAANQPNAIRILHWNTMSFGESLQDRVKGSYIREKMLTYIQESDAEVLCLQEFYDSNLPTYNNNITYITSKLGYPNYIYTRDHVRTGKVDSTPIHGPIGYLGNAIFTKLPVVDSGIIQYDKLYLNNKESVAYLDVLKNEKRIRIFTTHLQSIQLKQTDYNEVYKVKEVNKDGLEASKNVFAKIKNAYTYRSSQAQVLAQLIAESPYPCIVTGDFNDIPNSYTYATISKNMQDVFLEKGFGIGRTFSAISPTLRIDYMLASKQFAIKQVVKNNLNLSDHYPLIGDLELQ